MGEGGRDGITVGAAAEDQLSQDILPSRFCIASLSK